MKELLLLILLGAMFSCASSKSYQLNDSDENKDFLNQVIKGYYKKGFEYENPSVVLDGLLYNGADSKSISNLNIKKCELGMIHFLNPNAAKNIYGEIGERGIVLIKSKACEANEELVIRDDLK